MVAPLPINGPNGRVIVEVPATKPLVIEVGIQGPAGPPGYGVLISETAVDLLPGVPVYATGTSTFDLAQADALPRARCLGLSRRATTAGFSGEILAGGPLELSPEEWEVVTGTPGGLLPGVVYYLSPTLPGIIQPVSPVAVGEFSVKVGQAITAGLFEIDPRNPIRL